MNYFIDIRSFAELKKEYRRLAKENHPDKGGDTTIMQQINIQFKKLFEEYKDKPVHSRDATGYEDDYADANASQYADYVYNEYRYTGKNYKGQSNSEITTTLRKWLKETYPRYRFSVTMEHGSSIRIYLISADFAPFLPESKKKCNMRVNHYHIEKDEDLTDRAKEVLINIRGFIMSYNYDDSDVMTDYHNTNFYLTMGIGTHQKPFKQEIPKLAAKKGDAPKVFKYPEGAAHKAIRQVLSRSRFGEYETNCYGKIIVLGNDNYTDEGERYFYPLYYSAPKTAQKRIDKLATVGINSRLTGGMYGLIEFLGYTPETEAALERERQEYTDAYRKWQTANTDATIRTVSN